MLGSGGVICIDDAQCMVKQIARLARFFAHESCAQCTQCREGTAWTTKIMERIEAGQGTHEDLDTLLDIADNMTAKTICVLSDSCAVPVVSGIKSSATSSRRISRSKRCPFRAATLVGRGGRMMSATAMSDAHERDARWSSVTIEGRTGAGPGRHVDPRSGQDGRRADSALLLSPGTPRRGRVPDVPRGSREVAEARAGVRDRRWRKVRSSTCTRDTAREARKGVLEMLLINHPLDCPICDQSGECELQDYTFAEGRKDSRYREAKRFNPVEDFGGDVMYVPNRCILCTRCVRFMEDVAHDPVLNVSERGDRAVIGKFEGQDLTHPWAGNVVELCPVGALLSKDFLNKARSWDLDRSASICPTARRAATSTLETRDNVVVRMRPRRNDDVNKFFLCDEGRLNYRWLNRRDRVEFPHVREGTALGPVDWDVAIEAAAAALRGRRVHRPRLAVALQRGRCFCCRSLIGRVGGAGVFRVQQGPEAPLEGVPGPVAARGSCGEWPRCRAAGFPRGRETPLDGPAPRRRAAHRGRGARGRRSGRARRGSRRRRRSVVVIGTTLPAWARNGGGRVCRSPTWRRKRERSPIFADACSGICRRRQRPGLARPGWAALADLLTALGEPTAYFLPARCVRGAGRARARRSPG